MEYDQQPSSDSGHLFFSLYADDLMLCCDKEAANGGWMNILPRLLSCQGSSVSCCGRETDVRFQSSWAICSQISALSFDMDCPSTVEASSSPCHQRCRRRWSYKRWWMKAVKHRLGSVKAWHTIPAFITEKSGVLTRVGRANTTTGSFNQSSSLGHIALTYTGRIQMIT